MWAARKGHGAIVERLLKAGADPAHTDRSGHTARDLAVEAGHPEVLSLLDTPSTSL
ncbi:ankyrin repeat domain-containing protein [Pistricoccus aurantiacus]|uniref:ankyrin repeat domain-containing protein n=1 Tax=Pistricoccus aurantiacus TaxID=1883414 RepID=UPI003638F5D0